MAPKASPSELAVLGGPPAFAEPKHVGRPSRFDRDRLLARVGAVLESEWFTNNGRHVQELERRLCEVTGTRHCIPICNGTVALELAIRALGLEGEVILPAFTFVATAHAAEWQGITPVFCDVDEATLCLDPTKLEALITPRTSGIIGVHAFGQVCDVDAIDTIARRRGLKVLYDAAHALGCGRDGRRVGAFGDAEVFSFHATKFISTFEGGAVATDDDELAARLRLMKNFGFAGTDRVVHVGTNGKMSELSAAMGLTSLEAMSDIVAANRRNLEGYQRGLASVPGLRLVTRPSPDPRNYQYVVVEVDEAAAGLRRDHLVEVLSAEQVLARRYFYPGCHRMEPYRSRPRYAELDLAVTERMAERVVTLPTGTSISSDDVATICSIIGVAVAAAGAVRGAVALPGPATPETR